MGLLANKKGDSALHMTIVLVIIIAIFFAGMFAFISRTGNNAAFYEQLYAKQISLLIDNSKPGTLITLNSENIKPFLDKEELYGEAVSFSNNEVTVKLSNSVNGYSFKYFSDYSVDAKFEQNGRFLRILVEEKA